MSTQIYQIADISPKKNNRLVVWLIVNTLVTYSLIFTRNFYLNISFAAWMMSSGSIGGILSGLAADFFPTHIK